MSNVNRTANGPITFQEMYQREGLASNTIMREDEVTWDLWMPSTNLAEVENASLYPGKIVNTGDAVRVFVNGRNIGAIEPRALPEAVEALRAYGGQEAPAYVKGSNTKGRTNSVFVVKPPKLRGA
jgi:hypothetical protein